MTTNPTTNKRPEAVTEALDLLHQQQYSLYCAAEDYLQEMEATIEDLRGRALGNPDPLAGKDALIEKLETGIAALQQRVKELEAELESAENETNHTAFGARIRERDKDAEIERLKGESEALKHDLNKVQTELDVEWKRAEKAERAAQRLEEQLLQRIGRMVKSEDVVSAFIDGIRAGRSCRENDMGGLESELLADWQEAKSSGK